MIKFRAERVRSGVDIIKIKRIERVVLKYGDQFLTRIYTRAELDRCRGKVEELAVRWAAKEAISKLLGTGIHQKGAPHWREIEILNNSQGKPVLNLYGRAERRANQLELKSVDLSLTHSESLALAFAIAII